MCKICGLLWLIFFFQSTFLSAAEYIVDPIHSHVGFVIRHIVGKVHGEYKDFDGNFSFDPKTPEKSKGKFIVKAGSINTNNIKRDDHLKSADFFDVKKFKTLEFAIKNVKATSGNKYVMQGDLTVHGVTKLVTFDVEFSGADKDPWDHIRTGFSASAKINRKDYKIIWNKVLDSGSLMIGEEVEITLNIEAVEKK
ncbi:MAG: YceI family protein [Deltaproteobacteria bacterium]|nr:YceI family protein [Deltaproteobacteria bacterium]